MTTFRRILVVLDPSLAETPAVDRAVALGRATGADLLLAFHDPGPRIGARSLMPHAEAKPLEQWMREGETTRLHELAAMVREQSGAKVEALDESVRLRADHVATLVATHRIDLVIKDVGHEPALRRLLFSCVDWDLLRTLSVPLWLASPKHQALPARILAAVDPIHPEHGAGHLNDTILGTAHAIAKAGHASLKVVTAFEGLPPQLMAADPSGMSLPYALDDLYEQLREAHAKAFAELLSRRHVSRSDSQVLYGPAPSLLADAASEMDAGLLVVGVIRRSGLDRLAMGSTAERLISIAGCDVLAVPTSFVGPVATELAAATLDVA